MKLAQLRKFALSLPEATEEPHFDYASFRVRGKISVPAVVEHLVRQAWEGKAPKRLLPKGG